MTEARKKIFLHIKQCKLIKIKLFATDSNI